MIDSRKLLPMAFKRYRDVAVTLSALGWMNKWSGTWLLCSSRSTRARACHWSRLPT